MKAYYKKKKSNKEDIFLFLIFSIYKKVTKKQKKNVSFSTLSWNTFLMLPCLFYFLVFFCNWTFVVVFLSYKIHWVWKQLFCNLFTAHKLKYVESIILKSTEKMVILFAIFFYFVKGHNVVFHMHCTYLFFSMLYSQMHGKNSFWSCIEFTWKTFVTKNILCFIL